MAKKKNLRKKKSKSKKKDVVGKFSKRLKKKIRKNVKSSLTRTQRLYLNIYMYLAISLVSFQSNLVDELKKLKKGLAQETEETKEMLEIYLMQSQGKATKRQIKKANKQLRDVMKSLGLGVLIVLPFAPITLPLIVKLGSRLGVDVLPDSFKSKG